MPIIVTVEQEIRVGEPIVIEAAAPDTSFVGVFEDDGNTGYFYALDSSAEHQQIRDALQIYNVANVMDTNNPSKVKIGWSSDGTKVVLLINDYPHAIFDFSAKQGFCRTGFPPPSTKGEWSSRDHSWSEDALQLFA